METLEHVHSHFHRHVDMSALPSCAVALLSFHPLCPPALLVLHPLTVAPCTCLQTALDISVATSTDMSTAIYRHPWTCPQTALHISMDNFGHVPKHVCGCIPGCLQTYPQTLPWLCGSTAIWLPWMSHLMKLLLPDFCNIILISA